MPRPAELTDPVGAALDFVWNLRDELQQLGLSLALLALIAATVAAGVGLSNLLDGTQRRRAG